MTPIQRILHVSDTLQDYSSCIEHEIQFVSDQFTRIRLGKLAEYSPDFKWDEFAKDLSSIRAQATQKDS